MAESVSKLRSEVYGLTNVGGKGGVDIMADEDTFKSTYDILHEISKVWGDMSDINRSALLEKLAGKVRSNQVAALLENFDQAEKVLETSRNAKGTMSQVHARWMDSVEARQAQFKAAQETASMAAMPASTLKGLYQAGTTGLGLLTNMMNIFGSGGVGIGAIGTAAALKSGAGNIWAGLGQALNWHIGGRGQKGLIDAYNLAYGDSLSPTAGRKQDSLRAAENKTGITANKYTQNLVNNTDSTIDAAKATSSLATSLKGLAKNALGAVATFGAIELASWGAQAAWKWLDENVINKGQHLAEIAAASHAEYTSAKTEAKTAAENKKTIQEQIDSLTSKKESGTITSEEQARLAMLNSEKREADFQSEIADRKAMAAATKSLNDWVHSYDENAPKGSVFSYVSQFPTFKELESQYRSGTNNKRSPEQAMQLESMYWQAVEMSPKDRDAWIAATIRDLSPERQAQQKADKELEKLSKNGASSAAAQAVSSAVGLSQLSESFKDEAQLNAEDLVRAYTYASQSFDGIKQSIDEAGGFDKIVSDLKLDSKDDSYKALEQVYTNWANISGYLASQTEQYKYEAQTRIDEYITAGRSAETDPAITKAVQEVMAGAVQLTKVQAKAGEENLAVFDLIDSILNVTTFGDALDTMTKLAADGKSAEEIVRSVGDSFTGLQSILKLFGVDMNWAADMAVENVKVSEKKPDEPTVPKTGFTQERVDAITNAQSLGAKLWKSTGFTGSLDPSSKEYQELMSMDDGAYRAAIDYANGTLFFDKDAFDQIVQQKYKEQLADLRADAAEAEKKFAAAAQTYAEQLGKKTANAKDFDETAYTNAIKDIQTYGDNLTSYRSMMAQIDYGMSGLANWLSNKGGAESGDVYDELGKAAKAIRSGKESGLVGTREFRAALQFYGGENLKYEDLTSKDWGVLAGLAGVGKDGSSSKTVRKDTLYALKREFRDAGVLDKNGTWTPGMTTDEAAKLYNKKYGANLNGEAVQAIFMALNDYNTDSSMDYTFTNDTPVSNQKVLDAQDAFKAAVKAYNENTGSLEDVQKAAQAYLDAVTEDQINSENTLAAANAALSTTSQQNGGEGGGKDPLTGVLANLVTALTNLNKTLGGEEPSPEKPPENPPEGTGEGGTKTPTETPAVAGAEQGDNRAETGVSGETETARQPEQPQKSDEETRDEAVELANTELSRAQDLGNAREFTADRLQNMIDGGEGTAKEITQLTDTLAKENDIQGAISRLETVISEGDLSDETRESLVGTINTLREALGDPEADVEALLNDAAAQETNAWGESEANAVTKMVKDQANIARQEAVDAAQELIDQNYNEMPTDGGPLNQAFDALVSAIKDPESKKEQIEKLTGQLMTRLEEQRAAEEAKEIDKANEQLKADRQERIKAESDYMEQFNADVTEREPREDAISRASAALARASKTNSQYGGTADRLKTLLVGGVGSIDDLNKLATELDRESEIWETIDDINKVLDNGNLSKETKEQLGATIDTLTAALDPESAADVDTLIKDATVQITNAWSETETNAKNELAQRLAAEQAKEQASSKAKAALERAGEGSESLVGRQLQEALASQTSTGADIDQLAEQLNKESDIRETIKAVDDILGKGKIGGGTRAQLQKVRDNLESALLFGTTEGIDGVISEATQQVSDAWQKSNINTAKEYLDRIKEFPEEYADLLGGVQEGLNAIISGEGGENPDDVFDAAETAIGQARERQAAEQAEQARREEERLKAEEEARERAQKQMDADRDNLRRNDMLPGVKQLADVAERPEDIRDAAKAADALRAAMGTPQEGAALANLLNTVNSSYRGIQQRHQQMTVDQSVLDRATESEQKALNSATATVKAAYDSALNSGDWSEFDEALKSLNDLVAQTNASYQQRSQAQAIAQGTAGNQATEADLLHQGMAQKRAEATDRAQQALEDALQSTAYINSPEVAALYDELQKALTNGELKSEDIEALTTSLQTSIQEYQQTQQEEQRKLQENAKKGAIAEAFANEEDEYLQQYGEAYDRAKTSNAYKTNGPGRQALDKALQKLETAFGDKDWNAFEQAVQELDDLMSAVDAADQERGEREERDQNDAESGAALKARAEQRRQDAIARAREESAYMDQFNSDLSEELARQQEEAVERQIQQTITEHGLSAQETELYKGTVMPAQSAQEQLASRLGPLTPPVTQKPPKEEGQVVPDTVVAVPITEDTQVSAAEKPELTIAQKALAAQQDEQDRIAAETAEMFTREIGERHQISGKQMQEAGWTDVPEDDYATLYSSTVTGDGKTVLVTPITPEGEILSPDELDEYIGELLQYDPSEMFEHDTLGLLLAAMNGENGRTIARMDAYGQEMHLQQEQQYGTGTGIPTLTPTPTAAQNQALDDLYDQAELLTTAITAYLEQSGLDGNEQLWNKNQELQNAYARGDDANIGRLVKEAQELYRLVDQNADAAQEQAEASQEVTEKGFLVLANAGASDVSLGLPKPGQQTTDNQQSNVGVVAEADTRAAQKAINNIHGTEVPVDVTADTSAAQAAVDNIDGGTVNVDVQYNAGPMPSPNSSIKDGGSSISMDDVMHLATGTGNAEKAMYLVDERGQELIEHVSQGTYELGTNDGPRFTRLDAGDIVHTAKETRKILRRGGAMANGGKVKTGQAATTGAGSNNQFGNNNGIPPGAQSAINYAKQQQQLNSGTQPASLSQYLATGTQILKFLQNTFDWIPTFLSVLKKKTTEFINAADDAIHYIGKNKMIDSAIGNVAAEIQANMLAALRYREFLVGMAYKGALPLEIIHQIQNGTLDIQKYQQTTDSANGGGSDEGLFKAINSYQEYWNKLVACQDALKGLNDQMEALAKQKMDNIVRYFEQIDDLLSKQQKSYESLLDLKKQYGQEVNAEDYTASLKTLEDMLDNTQNEETAVVAELSDQLGIGEEIVQALLDGGKELWELIGAHVQKATDLGIQELTDNIDVQNDSIQQGIDSGEIPNYWGSIYGKDPRYGIHGKSIFDAMDDSGKNNLETLIDEMDEAAKNIDTILTNPGEEYFSADARINNFRLPEISYNSDGTIGKLNKTGEIVTPDQIFPLTMPVEPEVEPPSEEDIRRVGEMLGLNMVGDSEEVLANYEMVKSLFTTTWENPLAIGSETWYSYMATLEELRGNIYATKVEIGEMNDEIAKIPLTNLQTGFDYLEDIMKNLEGVNDLLDAQGSTKSSGTYQTMISVGMKQIENLEEQNKLIEEQMSLLDPLSEKYQELRDDLNNNLDSIADIRENQERWNDAIIDLQIDRLRKQNDKYKEQLSLMRALDDLENARQRRILTYHDETGFVYEADEDAMEAAQESAFDAVYSSMINRLEDQKELSNIYGPLGERLIQDSSIVDSLGNILVPVEDKLSGLDFGAYYQSILDGAEQTGLLTSLLNSIDMTKLLESAIRENNISIDLSGMTLNEVNDVKDLCDAIMQQLPNYLLQAMYQKGA